MGMDTDEAITSVSSTATASDQLTPSSLPEVEMYAYMLVLLYLSDNKLWELVGCFEAFGAVPALTLCTFTLALLAAVV